jgi:glycosyltransferase involved in cell wall biosynthesis
LSVPVTVIICALDEERNIGDCLRSVVWADQVFVVDSFSSDRTAEIAKSLGAEVVEHRWEGYSTQKNWAMESLPIKHDWVFFCDADWRIPDALAGEIEAAVMDSTSEIVGYHIPWRFVFIGKLLKHTGGYSARNLALFRRSAGRYDARQVGERPNLSGKTALMRNVFVHDDHHDMFHFLYKHNRYSTWEAMERLRLEGPDARQYHWTGDWGDKRQYIKHKIWYRLPCRPLIRFIMMYVVFGGFLDGFEGLALAVNISKYEFDIDVKLHEMRRSTKKC